MKALFTIVLLLITVSTVVALPAQFQQELYAQGASQPTAMQFAPDGRLFIAEKLPSCQLSVIEDGVFHQTPFYSMSYWECNSDWEMGLLGVAFDPNFENNGYVYMYHTRNTNPITHRVIRVTEDPLNPNVALPGSEVIILDNIPGEAGNHNGGAIHFGLDGTLYIAVGDGGSNPQNSQRTDTMMGKLLRINPDGSVPADNPFVGNPAYLPEIYALGLRNPFTFAIDPLTDSIHVNDVGGGGWEEINDIIPGGNYGWPQCEGACNPSNPAFEDPRFAYPHWGGSGPNGHAITGGTFYRGNTFPAQYSGAYFFGDYTQTWIYVLLPDNSVEQFSTTSNNPIDLKVGPDGALYFANFNTGEVRRIQYYGAQENIPPVAAASANPTQGLAPLTVTLSAAASSDQNNDPLTFTWNPGDGTGNQVGMIIEHTYQTSGQYTAVVEVCDGQACDNASVSVIVGALPQPTITLPVEESLYVAGQAVSYQGSGVDSQGNAIPPEGLSWMFVLHHDAHTHPFLGPITGASGSITPTPSGHTEHTVWYRFILQATDAYGFTNSTFVDVHPHKANLTFVTEPSGLTFELEGQPRQAPHEVRSVVGITRTVNAPSPQTLDGVEYVLSSWSHSAEQENSFASPAQDTTYTATFSAVEIPVFLVGDRNNDGVVNVQDILIIINHFGRAVATHPEAEVADINGDGVINVFDLVLVAREFGQSSNPPPAENLEFSNMPSGMTVHTDAEWTSVPSGWGLGNRQGTIGIVSDPSSPTGSSLRMHFPAGLPSGQEAGVAYIGAGSMSNANEMFMGTVMKYSSNWVPNANQVKLQLWNIQNTDTETQLQWFGIFDGCWGSPAGHWSIASWGSNPITFPNKVGDCWVNNVQSAPVYETGTWVKQEWYAQRSTPGQSNGIVRMWIQGVLVLEVTNLSYPDNWAWSEFQHAGTYGGGGVAVPHDQQIYFARTVLAYR